MTAKRRIGTLLASGAIVVGGVLGGTQAALADGPDTPPEVLAEINEMHYPVLQEGDSRWEVAVVEFLLVDYGYFDVPHVDEDFDSDLADAVLEYQADNGLTENGDVDGDTWNQMRDDFGESALGDNGLRVKAVQYALLEGYGYDLVVDAKFGPNTRDAVLSFQETVGIDADGIVGPVTFKALVSYES